MNQNVPQSTTSLECPALKKKCKVTFEVNVFRGAARGGLEMTSCSELQPNTNMETCGQECIQSHEAQQLHEQAIRQHQDELSTIGSNVIG